MGYCAFCDRKTDELFVLDQSEADENQKRACRDCINEIEELDHRARANSSGPPSCNTEEGALCPPCLEERKED